MGTCEGCSGAVVGMGIGTFVGLLVVGKLVGCEVGRGVGGDVGLGIGSEVGK